MKADNSQNPLFDIAGDLLEKDCKLRYRLKGWSMFPTLQPADEALVEHYPKEQLKKGDIIVFRQKNQLIGHRIIAIDSSDGKICFHTRGDNSKLFDDPVSSENVLGIIHQFWRKGKLHNLRNNRLSVSRSLALHGHWIQLFFTGAALRISLKKEALSRLFTSFKKNSSFVLQNSQKQLIQNCIIQVLQGILPFLLILSIKYLIDALTQTSHNIYSYRIYGLLAATALCFLLNGILSEINSYFSEKLSQSVQIHIYKYLHQRHSELQLSAYENSDKQDKIHRVVQEASFRPSKLINDILLLIRSVIASLFLIGIFISVKWYLILLLSIAVFPGILVRLKMSGAYYQQKEKQSTTERAMYYYNRILTGFPFAKELRLFGFANYFTELFHNTQSYLFTTRLQLRRKELVLGIFTQLFAVVLIFGTISYVTHLSLTGAISIGTVVLFFFSFQRGYSVINDLFKALSLLVEDTTYMNDLTEFLTKAPTQYEKESPAHSFSLQDEIVFENVSFEYENSEREALHDVNIRIKAGKTIALVGENGSGKSTFIKLLCGFYQPSNGKISFDGVNLKEIGESQLRQHISAVFQDFALYHISALENIALGNNTYPPDKGRVIEAAKMANIDEVLSALPHGYNTTLGNLFKGGEELSIGQWQKIAIARACYRNAPLILMDEPSSALDPKSEAQIINGLKKLSKDKTAIIVSHRLSTVEWTDEILFFENGSIVEHGSHTALMASGGKYATLFKQE